MPDLKPGDPYPTRSGLFAKAHAAGYVVATSEDHFTIDTDTETIKVIHGGGIVAGNTEISLFEAYDRLGLR